MNINNNMSNSYEKVKIVTSGSSYLDIDAYGGCIAYRELLSLQGYKAKAVSSASFNESITPSIRSWKTKLDNYVPRTGDEFILIDVSNRDFIDPIVKEDNVIEVIDHHTGFESYWKKKLGKKSNIEFIGSACTLIFEKYQYNGLLCKISKDSARLLATGILENTLNFQANITTKRDINAYKILKEIAELPDSWNLQYFSEFQHMIELNLEKAIQNDLKTIKSIDCLPSIFGQLVVWEGLSILHDKFDVIEETIEKIGKDWILNIVSISEGKSYFLSSNAKSQSKITQLIGVEFDGNIAAADRLWLRKEVLKKVIGLT